MVKELFSKEEKNKLCNELITFFNEERGETIGIIQAEKFIDFFLENFGKEVYNKGIEDAKNKFASFSEEFQFNLEELKK